jgi:hypothetical protein
MGAGSRDSAQPLDAVGCSSGDGWIVRDADRAHRRQAADLRIQPIRQLLHAPDHILRLQPLSPGGDLHGPARRRPRAHDRDRGAGVQRERGGGPHDPLVRGARLPRGEARGGRDQRRLRRRHLEAHARGRRAVRPRASALHRPGLQPGQACGDGRGDPADRGGDARVR